MKPSGPGLLFVGRFFITVLISVLVMGLLKFSISSWLWILKYPRTGADPGIWARYQSSWLSSPKYLRADTGLFVSVAKVTGILRMVSTAGAWDYGPGDSRPSTGSLVGGTSSEDLWLESPGVPALWQVVPDPRVADCKAQGIPGLCWQAGEWTGSCHSQLCDCSDPEAGVCTLGSHIWIPDPLSAEL